jgi:hypothetical protein
MKKRKLNCCTYECDCWEKANGLIKATGSKAAFCFYLRLAQLNYTASSDHNAETHREASDCALT